MLRHCPWQALPEWYHNGPASCPSVTRMLSSSNVRCEHRKLLRLSLSVCTVPAGRLSRTWSAEVLV